MNGPMAKACTKCMKTMPIGDFRADKRYADGHVTWCKPCTKEYRAQYYAANRDKVRSQNAKWYEANKDKVSAMSRAAYMADPIRHGERVRAAKARRPEHYKALAAKNARKRRSSDPASALRARISSQLTYCLSTGKGGRTSEELLGYSMSELRTHLERQFIDGMTWETMGKWHIDHIVPLSSFTITSADDPELRKAWALPNLRPLWAKDNIRKGASRETLL